VDGWTGGPVDRDCKQRGRGPVAPHTEPVTSTVTDNPPPNSPNQQQLSRESPFHSNRRSLESPFTRIAFRSGYSHKTQSVLEEYRRISADS